MFAAIAAPGSRIKHSSNVTSYHAGSRLEALAGQFVPITAIFTLFVTLELSLGAHPPVFWTALLISIANSSVDCDIFVRRPFGIDTPDLFIRETFAANLKWIQSRARIAENLTLIGSQASAG